MSRWMAMSICVLLAGAARATDVSAETGLSTTRATPQNPRTGNLTSSIDASADVAEMLSLTVGAVVTLEGTTPSSPSSPFPDRGGVVTSWSTGLEQRIGEHWAFSLTGSASPSSTQHAPTELFFTNANGATTGANALIRATSSGAGLQLHGEYDSAGDSNFEWSLAAGIDLNHLRTDQRVVMIQEASGAVVSSADVLRYCQTHVCAPALVRALEAQPPAMLDSARLSLNGTLVFGGSTELGLTVDYYGYSQDPSQIGYFSIGTAGRLHVAGGSGVPIAPLRSTVRPELVQHFGDFAAGVWIEGGRYVEKTGQNTGGAGLRLQYRFTKEFRGWITAASRRDEDAQGAVSVGSSFTVGAGYVF